MSAGTLLDLTEEADVREEAAEPPKELHRCCSGCAEELDRWIAFCGADRTGRGLVPESEREAWPHCAMCDAAEALVDLTGLCPRGKHIIIIPW